MVLGYIFTLTSKERSNKIPTLLYHVSYRGRTTNRGLMSSSHSNDKKNDPPVGFETLKSGVCL